MTDTDKCRRCETSEAIEKDLLAIIKRLNRQLVRATEWAYKQYCYKQEKMEDYDNYVWGEQE